MTKQFFLFAAALALAISATPVFANGYNDYPSRLCWSPDGSFVAAAVDDELWIVFPVGYADMIVQGDVSSPSVSPDGMMVAYVLRGSLYVYSFYEHEEVPVDMSGNVLDCAFETVPGDRDEYTLYYSKGDRFYGCDIYGVPVMKRMAGLSIGSEFNLTNTPDISECAPSPSPLDGSIYFLSQGGKTPGGYEQIWRMKDSKSRPKAATKKGDFGDWGYHESYPAFFEETTVFFERGGWGLWDIYALNPKTGREGQVFMDASKPSVSRYRGVLAFTRPDYNTVEEGMETWDYPLSVWIVDLDTGFEFQASPPGVWSDFPAVSPDGTHVAWLEFGPGRTRVVLRTTVDAVG